MSNEFVGFPKIPRLYRDMVITEKIDGTNGCIIVDNEIHPSLGPIDDQYVVYAQSRKRVITPDSDNHGFARWVEENRDHLIADLGVGRHFGEWWGNGINRGYDLPRGDKRFSLFNTKRWYSEEFITSGLWVVPVLYHGMFSDREIRDTLEDLKYNGSSASPGFMNPEGVVIYHTAANQLFKVTIENDEFPKESIRVVA